MPHGIMRAWHAIAFPFLSRARRSCLCWPFHLDTFLFSLHEIFAFSICSLWWAFVTVYECLWSKIAVFMRNFYAANANNCFRILLSKQHYAIGIAGRKKNELRQTEIEREKGADGKKQKKNGELWILSIGIVVVFSKYEVVPCVLVSFTPPETLWEFQYMYTNFASLHVYSYGTAYNIENNGKIIHHRVIFLFLFPHSQKEFLLFEHRANHHQCND